MPLQRAISTLGCPALSLDEALVLAARFRLDALELRALSGSLDLPALFEKTHGTPGAFAAALRDGPVRIHCLDTSFVLTGADSAARAALLRFVPWAEALGGLPLRVFDGAAGEASGRAAALDMLDWWRERRAAAGWRSDLVIETHDSLLGAGGIRDFLDRAPAGTRILWDAHHTWRKGGEPPGTTWRTIADAISHIHVKDSASLPGEKEPYTYVPPGEGGFPMRELLDALRTEARDITLVLEWERQWHPALAPLESALESAVQNRWW
jgi:sugar phosphate isomerase/epimerase